MHLNVAAVIFDFARGQPHAATIPLRYDAIQPVLLPEWQRGQRVPAVAAYALDRLGATVDVRVCFTATPDVPRTVEVRAVAEAPGGGPLPFPPLVGDLAPESVSFDPQGASAWQTFTFDSATLAVGGVDSATLQWRWQARIHPAWPWVDVDATQHRIYVLLSAPTEPWSVFPADPSNPSLPRTDLLDIACLWTRGARDARQAAARATEAVNRLGGSTFFYDASVGAPHYTVLGVPRFLCDAFLDRLRGGPGTGPLVNCSDCATIVSTLANLVGADLWQSKMGLVGAGFRLNPLLAIGAQEWSTLHGGFGFHEVAWTGACGEDELVYDACVSLDADADPAGSPHVPLLPRGMRFGHPGDGGYRDRIALRDDRHACPPQSALRLRRSIAATRPAPMKPLPIPVARTLAQRVGEAPLGSDSGYRFEGFRWFGGELGPEWLPLQTMSLHNGPRRAEVAIWRSRRSPHSLLRVEATEAESPAEAHRAMLEVAGQVASPMLRPWRVGDDGSDEAGLALESGALALFTRGNLLLVARSAGLEPLDARIPARQLDRWLLDADTTPVPAASGGPLWRRWRGRSTSPSDSARPRLAVVTPAHAAAWRAPAS